MFLELDFHDKIEVEREMAFPSPGLRVLRWSRCQTDGIISSGIVITCEGLPSRPNTNKIPEESLARYP